MNKRTLPTHIETIANRLNSFLKLNKKVDGFTNDIMANVIYLTHSIQTSSVTNYIKESEKLNAVFANFNRVFNTTFSTSSTPEDVILFMFGTKGLSVYYFLKSIGLSETSPSFWDAMRKSLATEHNNQLKKEEFNNVI